MELSLIGAILPLNIQKVTGISLPNLTLSELNLVSIAAFLELLAFAILLFVYISLYKDYRRRSKLEEVMMRGQMGLEGETSDLEKAIPKPVDGNSLGMGSKESLEMKADISFEEWLSQKMRTDPSSDWLLEKMKTDLRGEAGGATTELETPSSKVEEAKVEGGEEKNDALEAEVIRDDVSGIGGEGQTSREGSEKAPDIGGQPPPEEVEGHAEQSPSTPSLDEKTPIPEVKDQEGEERSEVEKEERTDDIEGEMGMDDKFYEDIRAVLTQAYLYGYTEMAKSIKKINDDMEKLNEKMAKCFREGDIERNN